MDIMDTNNIFLISLWKLGVSEVINNRNYHLPDNITKIALKLSNQNLSLQEEDLLELHNWLLIEVEPILVDASAEELEDYIKSHFDEINRAINESEIINPEKEDEVITFNKKEDDCLDSFFNTSDN